MNSAVPSELQVAAQNLGLQKYRRHIFLCADQTEPKCAPREQGLKSWDYLKRRLNELKLAGPEPLVYRTPRPCQHRVPKMRAQLTTGVSGSPPGALAMDAVC